MKNFKILFAFVLGFAFFTTNFLFLFSTDTAFAATCTNLTALNIRHQTSDTSTAGQVSTLQNFLYSSGYLTSIGTGYFGNLTLAAVKKFQLAYDLPPTGFVGALTKAKIRDVSCGGGTGIIGGGGGTISTNTICAPGVLYNTQTGALCSGIQTGGVCTNGAIFNTQTGAPCSGNVSGAFNLSSSIYSYSDTSKNIDYTIYDPSNSYSYNVYVSCPSNVTVNYLNSNACGGSIRLFSDTKRFSLIAYNNSGSSQNLTVRVSAVNNYGNVIAEDTDTVTLSGRSNSIEVTNPDSGQSYAVGDTMNIRWNASNISSSVIIELVKGSSVYGTISYSAQNTGAYSWTIPSSAPAGTDNRIRITDAYNSSYYDNSNGVFSITQSAYSSKSINTFNFTNPSATGVIDEVNKTVTISVPFGTNVTALVPSITTSGNSTITPASGVPKDFTTYKDYVVRAQDGTTQTYRVTVNKAVATSDKAILTFNFTNPAATGSVNESAKTISVFFPVGTVVTSLTPTITVSDNATVSPASGVPKSFATQQTYTVTAQNGNTQAYVVTVSIAQPFLTLTIPNGGNSFQRGTTAHIAWDSLGVSNVRVELWNGATKIGDIPTAIPASDGSVDYLIPLTAPLGTTYKIKIIDAANTARTDLSDTAFSITENTAAQGFTFTSPTSGSNNFVGKPMTINWTTSGNVPNVGIAVIKGNSTTTLTYGTPNTGTYPWNVPAGQAIGNDYAIFIYNTVNGNIYAYSPRFNIVNGSMTITNPTLDSEYFTGKTLPITWTSAGYIPTVGVSYLKGTATTSLIANTPNTGTYPWNISSTQEARNDYSIFVYDTANGNVFAQSPKFKITVPNITVTAPSNTSITRGTNMNVTWTATNNVSTVKIELFKGAALAAGITNPIVPTISAAAGSATIFLPTNLAIGSDYYVKVTDTASTLSDKNDLPFTITDPLLTNTQITSFNLNAPYTIGTINEANKTVTLVIHSGIGTGVTVNPVITLGSPYSSVSPASGAPVIFTTASPSKIYTVTPQSGPAQTYTVTLVSQ